MTLSIFIDNKENTKFVSLLQAKLPSVSIQSLDVADIQFHYNTTPILYIERKTINDLAASLNDGRYHEQKARLKNRSRVIYLIEGSIDELNPYYSKVLDNEKFKGCIINTMVRDNIHIYQTKNMDESVQFITDIYKRLPKYIDQLLDPHSAINYANAIDIKKKNNNTPLVIFINQLRQIQGVSSSIAQVIADEYQSMSKLIEQFLIGGSDILADIKVNNRKLGKVLSQRIYENLFNIQKSI